MNTCPQDRFLNLEDAIAHSPSALPRNLLLGNGYSIAASENFKYKTLKAYMVETPTISLRSTLKKVFSFHELDDLEEILRDFDSAIRLSEFYNKASSFTAIQTPLQLRFSPRTQLLRIHRAYVGRALIQTLREIHPQHPEQNSYENKISEKQITCNGNFLKHFINQSDSFIFTLNYDLLLYWSLLQNFPSNRFIDGFYRRPDSTQDTTPKFQERLYFDNTQVTPTVFFLHGALHLRQNIRFGADKVIRTYDMSGSPLSDTLLGSLQVDIRRKDYPLVVFEGNTQQKIQKIASNPYLSAGYKQLIQTSGSLFTYGFSFSQNDTHILEAIGKSSVTAVYIGVHTPLDIPPSLIAAKALLTEKHKKQAFFYSTVSEQIW